MSERQDNEPDPTGDPNAGRPWTPPEEPTSQRWASPDPGQYGPTDNPSGYGSTAYGPQDPPSYDVNPYDGGSYGGGYGGVAPYGMPAVQHPQAVTALVLGILGLVICPPVGIGGWILGGKARKSIDAEPQRYTGRGIATAGWVLGIIASIYTVLLVIGLIIFVVIGLAGGFDT